ncbi:galactose-1-phosphate uridylyltransferase [Thermosipho atlanticus]|uniref:Galactose-1-phosphate uridylyltransferase n=1 Tax=Thermosipho atlanticus DSM 15807 TaxID=1123380 RepID=A0A1M5QV40_9BACT|nr:galactose-1-phosphate uridylyltransferase [Thermosipho atlanticus]SHH17569.1 UDPglucose--hexose-1-phosphate uridylyltransferase [Thermosipho atlanticus DSM 15807]
MMELRYNPLTDEWIIVSAATQRRPVQPSKTECPLCPGGLELPEEYDLVAFENRFPSLKMPPPEIDWYEKGPFRKNKSFGICEVIVYTSEHNSALPKMSLSQVEKLVEVWVDRTLYLSKIKQIRYIYIFENRGKEVGASLSHPHGQLYAFPFIPKRIEVKIEAMSKWYEEKNECPICSIMKYESEERKVYETESFIAIVPFYARFPYEVHIYPKKHYSTILDFSNREKKEFSEILKVVTMKYDKLFEQDFPYMMMFFQAPFNTEDVSPFFHFHVEFNPPKRDKNKLKWMASVETGTWTFINPVLPEEAAKKLRDTEVTL